MKCLPLIWVACVIAVMLSVAVVSSPIPRAEAQMTQPAQPAAPQPTPAPASASTDARNLGFETLDRVDAFYKAAWANLLWVILAFGAAGAAIITLVPITISHLQVNSFNKIEKRFRADTKRMTETMHKTIESKTTELRTLVDDYRQDAWERIARSTADSTKELKSEIEALITESTAQLQVKISMAAGTAMFSVAMNAARLNPPLAWFGFLEAASHFAAAKAPEEISLCLGHLVTLSPALHVHSMDKTRAAPFLEDLQKLLSAISEPLRARLREEGKRYVKILEELRQALENRPPPAQPEPTATQNPDPAPA